MSQPSPQRKLSAVPDKPKGKSRQETDLARIEKHKKKNKLGTYAHPDERSPVLPANEISRRATKQIEPLPPLPPLPLRARITNWLKGDE